MFSQGQIIHGYNLLVDAMNELNINHKNLEKWSTVDVEGKCQVLSFAYKYYAHQGLRNEFFYFLRKIAFLKNKEQCIYLLKQINGKTKVELHTEFDTLLISSDKLFSIIESIGFIQKHSSLMEIGALWDKTYTFFCDKNKFSIHLKNVCWQEGQSAFIDMGLHFFYIEKAKNGFYLFESGGIDQNALSPDIPTEDKLAELIIEKIKLLMHPDNSNVAFSIQLIAYASQPQNTMLEDAILEIGNDLNNYSDIKILCDDYGKRKISRLDTAIAIQKMGVSQSNQSDKLNKFLTAITHYIESEEHFISRCFKYNLEHINQTAFIFETSFLFLACQLNQINLVENLLTNAKEKININQAIFPTRLGATLLYMACQNGQTAIVKLLLTHPNIDVNQAKRDGITPFYVACKNGNTTIVELLLTHPDIDVNQGFGGQTPLFIASHHGHIAVVELLLNLKHSHIIKIDQATNDGATPLFAASQNDGQLAIVQLLISRGASVDASLSARTENLLTIAEKNGRRLSLQQLLRLKNNGEIPEYLSTFTPLHAAIFLGHKKIVECLIAAQAGIHTTTGGLSCLEIAKIMGNDKIIHLVESKIKFLDSISSELNQPLRFTNHTF